MLILKIPRLLEPSTSGKTFVWISNSVLYTLCSILIEPSYFFTISTASWIAVNFCLLIHLVIVSFECKATTRSYSSHDICHSQLAYMISSSGTQYQNWLNHWRQERRLYGFPIASFILLVRFPSNLHISLRSLLQSPLISVCSFIWSSYHLNVKRQPEVTPHMVSAIRKWHTWFPRDVYNSCHGIVLIYCFEKHPKLGT